MRTLACLARYAFLTCASHRCRFFFVLCLHGLSSRAKLGLCFGADLDFDGDVDGGLLAPENVAEAGSENVGPPLAGPRHSSPSQAAGGASFCA
jgi:hypothetical protein